MRRAFSMDAESVWHSKAPVWGMLLGCRFSRPLLRQLSKMSPETFGFPRHREKQQRTEGITSLLLSQKARADYWRGCAHTQTDMHKI